MKWKKLEFCFELLIYGIVIGIVEDLLAVKLATNEPITWRVIGIVLLVSVPFAIIGELVFDRIDFTKFLKRICRKK